MGRQPQWPRSPPGPPYAPSTSPRHILSQLCTLPRVLAQADGASGSTYHTQKSAGAAMHASPLWLKGRDSGPGFPHWLGSRTLFFNVTASAVVGPVSTALPSSPSRCLVGVNTNCRALWAWAAQMSQMQPCYKKQRPAASPPCCI